MAARLDPAPAAISGLSIARLADMLKINIS
jgi:hypothetical protein